MTLYVPQKKELWLPRMPVPGPYFHGGKPGLKPGDMLTEHEPNYVDGCAICETKRRGGNPVIDSNPIHKGVYFTTDREYARFYASKYPRGDLYSVQPAGPILMAGDEDPFETAVCEVVMVRGLVQRDVRLDNGQRRRLLRRWADSDRLKMDYRDRMKLRDVVRRIR